MICRRGREAVRPSRYWWDSGTESQQGTTCSVNAKASLYYCMCPLVTQNISFTREPVNCLETWSIPSCMSRSPLFKSVAIVVAEANAQPFLVHGIHQSLFVPASESPFLLFPLFQSQNSSVPLVYCWRLVVSCMGTVYPIVIPFRRCFQRFRPNATYKSKQKR